MAEIKKTIKLIATLDDSAFKQQIASLKKQLGKDLSLNNVDVAEFKTALKDITKEFSKEIKEAFKNAAKARGGTGGGGTLGAGDTFLDKTKKLEIRKDREVSDARRKNVEKEWADINVRHDNLKKKLLKNADDVKRLNQSPLTRGLTAMGMDQQKARGLTGFAEGLSERTVGRVPGVVAGIGGVLGAARLASDAYADIQGIRRQMAQRQFAFSQSLTQQKALEGAVEKAGREEMLPKIMGGLGGAAGGATKYGLMGAAAGAGIGSIFGGIGAVPGAAIGGVLGGAYGLVSGGMSGAFRSSEEQAKLRREQTAPILEAMGRAQALAPSRLQLAQGGGIGNLGMTNMQAGGVGQGFGPEETIQQALQAREFLGNRGTRNNLGTLQRMQRVANVDVGLGAQAAETFAGGTGKGFAAGVMQQVEIIKKGVSSGLDVSKSSQFLKATADFIQQTAGFGKVDLEGIGGRMARNTAGFAGGGDVTQMDIERARSLEQLTRQESTATEGFAGIGNITGIQQAFGKAGQKLDPGMLMGLMNMSSNATPEDIKAFLQKGGMNPTDELVQSIQQVKGNATNLGAGAAGVGGTTLGTALIGKERGLTTEQQMGIENAQNFQGPLLSGDEALKKAEEQVKSTDEYRKAVADAAVSQTQVVAGLKEFNRTTEITTKGLENFKQSLDEASKKLNSFIGGADRIQRHGN